jgi:CHAT domain-containing protein
LTLRGNASSVAAGRNGRARTDVTAATTTRATQRPSPTQSDPVVNIKRRQVEELRKSQRRLRELVMGYIAAREVVVSCAGLLESTKDALRQVRDGGSPSDDVVDRLGSGLRSLKDQSNAGAFHELGRAFEALVSDLESAVSRTSDSLEQISWQRTPEYGPTLVESAIAIGIAHDKAAEIARLCRENSESLMRDIEASLNRIFDRMRDAADAARAEQPQAAFLEARAGRSTSVEQPAGSRIRIQPRVDTVGQRDATMNAVARGLSRDREPIKILFLAANPSDTGRLGLDEEMRAIDQALRETEFRELFDIEQQWAVRIGDLQGALLRFRPHIVHFSGHGTNTSELVLTNQQGGAAPVSQRALSELFMELRDNIRCVVLNACYSAAQANAIAEHIDCVVGMTKAVGDEGAIRFATAFYRALGYGRSIKTAFSLGTNEIDLEGLPDVDTPKLVAKRLDPAELVLVART